MPMTVTSSISRLPTRSIITRFTKVKMKLVAPTVMETAVGLVKPTRPNKVAE